MMISHSVIRLYATAVGSALLILLLSAVVDPVLSFTSFTSSSSVRLLRHHPRPSFITGANLQQKQKQQKHVMLQPLLRTFSSSSSSLYSTISDSDDNSSNNSDDDVPDEELSQVAASTASTSSSSSSSGNLLPLLTIDNWIIRKIIKISNHIRTCKYWLFWINLIGINDDESIINGSR